MSKIRLGTRSSELALWQAKRVQALLNEKGLESELVLFKTQGDKILDRPLQEIGSKGLFTEELEQAMLDGEIDGAIHSAKDVPTRLAKDFEIAAFLEREKSHDILVLRKGSEFLGCSLEDLPSGTRMGTSSNRRKAQFLNRNSSLEVVSIRGNVPTRIQKMLRGDCDILCLAYAGVHRLGLLDMEEIEVVHLDSSEFLPAVGQGSVAIESSPKAAGYKELKELGCHSTSLCISFERWILRDLEGGCSLPLGIYTSLEKEQLNYKVALLHSDGEKRLEISGSCTSQNWKHEASEVIQKLRHHGDFEMIMASTISS